MRRVALASAAALAAVTLARLPAAWESGNGLNHVSGVWLALADDLARGTLYRPLHAATGAFGGTRYFPLVFALEAALARAGVPLLVAGLALSLAAGILAAAGIAALLRALGAARADAAAAGALAFAGFAAQHALVSARGDLLPVALSAWGLAAVTRPGRASITAAGALLALAFAAKPTALGAATAAVVFLVLQGEARRAIVLAGLVGAGAAAAVATTEAASSGRFLASLAATASGGAGLDSLLSAPVRLAGEAAREDPVGLTLAGLALVACAVAGPALSRAARQRSRDPRLLPALWAGAAWAVALATYALPGTGVNHLVEVEAASAALLGAAGLPGVHRAPAARAAAALAAAGGIALAIGLWRTDRTSSRLAELRAVVSALPPAGPILAEDPLVPLVAGASPIVLDPFALRVAAGSDPALVAPLAAGLRAHLFAAVVLLADVDGPGAAEWYARGNLGAGLVSEVRRAYRAAGTFGRYHLYVPAPPDGGAVPRDAGVVRRDAAR